ncbi:hypothetical protein JCM4814A_10640 [Streptomyces phaeofaciens JCM 4814]|uniref:PE-PGRS family protein n=1 Tax=Streptomyces phaeofaciens TaxID=68254 RepID=A0A918HKK2_9ACTN|nr:hypothetical protein [Streptomyces phaeofaciens]GGT69003.1 hypothetical protein GCM10010226_53590 [Streptomyces phaeofaciens]
MEEQTYDPILSSDDVPKWRLTDPLRPPAPDRALVLVRDSGPSLTVRSGEEIPSSRFGAYRSVFTVDMTEHRLVLDIDVPSRDHTFSFRSRVDLVCRVADPAKVVERGIRDMSGALYGYLRKTLRTVARDYDIAEFHEAEIALNSALTSFGGDDAVRLRNIQIELLVDEEETAASGREFRNVVRETRLDGMRRRRHLDMIREEGVDGLIAEIMEKEGPRAALAWIEKGEAEKREVRREVMRMVLERGDGDREPFEQAELERAVLEEVLRDGDGLFETATRRGRLRGSLARALEPGTGEDDREPLRGEVVRDRSEEEGGRRGSPAERGDGESRGAPRSRVSGRRPTRPTGPAARPGRPPDDEPLPDERPAAAGGRVHDADERRTDRTRDDRRADPGGRPPTTGDADSRISDAPRRTDGRTAPAGGSADDSAPRVSRVRGTAKRPHGGGSHDGERR